MERIELDGGGTLDVRQEGAQVRLEAQREDDGRGLYKVWLGGAGGKLLLGTLAPECGRLRLCRRVSLDRLERAGCWPLNRASCVLAFSFDLRGGWVREQAEHRMTDPLLRKSARGLCALVRGEGDGFRLALPYDPAKPFGLTPLFCLARVERVEGQLCTVFFFDGQGIPRLPPGE